MGQRYKQTKKSQTLKFALPPFITRVNPIMLLPPTTISVLHAKWSCRQGPNLRQSLCETNILNTRHLNYYSASFYFILPRTDNVTGFLWLDQTGWWYVEDCVLRHKAQKQHYQCHGCKGRYHRGIQGTAKHHHIGWVKTTHHCYHTPLSPT